MNDYLKNLPMSDDNEELQQLSLKALKNILPTDKFLFRDERVDDKGVDASLEVKHEQSFTNFRSQVQLKGTSLSKKNKDGSVSHSVSTSNLNYLLNNPISLYILYIQPRSDKLLNQAQNITTKADISYLQIRLWFYQNQSNQFWSINTGKEYFVDKDVSNYFIKKLQNIINIYIEYQQNYSIIRAKMLMVEILSLLGKSEESETLRKQINSQANRMSYDALKNLTEFSLHKSLFDYAQDAKTQQNK